MLPQRMCAVCRQRRSKDELIRVVRCEDGNARIENDGKLFGRGAYICKSGDCVNQAAKRRAIERALSCNVDSCVYDALKEMSGDKDE